MKKLTLLRHAKSAWTYDVSDRERPLQEKGIHAIHAVAAYWKSLFSATDLLLTSPANRALHTASILAKVCALNFKKVSIHPPLYTFSGQELLRVIRHLDNAYEKVILVGHNPAFSVVADQLAQERVPEIKTAGWVELSFAVQHWQNIDQGTARWGDKKEAINQNKA